ncbi:MAG: L,D-transpeptidase [Actinomycetota bacterium]
MTSILDPFFTPIAGRLRRGALGVAIALGLLLTACGDGGADERPSDVGVAQATPDADDPSTGEPAPGDETPAAPAIRIARTDGEVTVRSDPAPEAPVVAELGATTSFGSPRALLVTGDAPGYLQVQVPQRPNFLVGWVDESMVDVVAGSHWVTVDLDARTLRVVEDGETVLETSVAVGAPDAPTPIGTYALVDRIQSTDPDGAYGPFALGLGAYSDTYSEFAGGDGQIGIHGTDDPSSIGQATSHGCVRVPNDVVRDLAEILPLGTPVTIT